MYGANFDLEPRFFSCANFSAKFSNESDFKQELNGILSKSSPGDMSRLQIVNRPSGLWESSRGVWIPWGVVHDRKVLAALPIATMVEGYFLYFARIMMT
mmetsp:Transcript_820/g.1831  ORF Transcript_820/g.1831 Transcript_820/m.1831 type:complete len:99 (+) Transcript_820:113-409(+)